MPVRCFGRHNDDSRDVVFEESGQWNGIEYRICKPNVAGHTARLSIDVHEGLLKRPGEQLETREIAFLGHNWRACVTAREDRSLEAVWQLCSPVAEGTSLRCCWSMTNLVSIPGPSSSLEQNGRYGGTLHSSQWRASHLGYISIHFRLALYPSTEADFTVCEGGDDICCVWRVRPRPGDAPFWTDTFDFDGKQWGIWLHGNGGSDIELDVLDLSSGDSVPVECRVLLIHPSSPERSYLKCENRMIAGVKPTIHRRDRSRSSERVIRFLFLLPRCEQGSADDAFVTDGWLKFGLRLGRPGAHPVSARAPVCLLETPRVAVEVLTDKRIRESVTKRGSVDVCDVPGSQVYLSPANMSLKTVRETILSDSGVDLFSTTLWLCLQKRNGELSTAIPVSALEDLDFRLCELGTYKSPRDHHPVVTFYLRPAKCDLLSNPSGGTVLLFCAAIDPAENKVEYLGSVLADGESKLHSVCFVELCRLVRRLEQWKCSFFLVNSTDRATPIDDFQKTVAESDVTSGNVILVRRTGDNEAMDGEKVQQELHDVRRDDASSDTRGRLVDDGFISRDVPCIICRDRPQTSGFYHGEMVHLFACEECVIKVHEQEPHRCPVCMQPYTGVVAKIF